MELINGDYDHKVYLTTSKYLNQITSNLLYWYNLLTESEKITYENLLSPLDKIFADALNISSNSPAINTDIYFDSFCESLLKSNKIILYGTGKVGGITFEFLKEKGLEKKVICFAVSNNNSENIRYGLKVYNINDLTNHKDALILIATGDNYHNEIKQKLIELNFDKYEVIDYLLQSNMKRYIDKITN